MERVLLSSEESIEIINCGGLIRVVPGIEGSECELTVPIGEVCKEPSVA